MKNIIFILLMTVSSISLQAGEKEDLKVALKTAYPKLEAEKIQSLEKFEKNSEGNILAVFLKDFIYFAYRKSASSNWIFKEAVFRDGASIAFKNKNRIVIHLEEGGSDHSETTSIWRLEEDSFKIIGQDYTASSGWNSAHVSASMNYLTGVVTASSQSAKQKKKSGTCKFEIEKYRSQSLSNLGVEGGEYPVCKYAEMPDK